jgi:iron complex outermembrane receptor protein
LGYRSLLITALVCGSAAEESKEQPPKYRMVVTGTYAPLPVEDVNRDVALVDLREQRPLFRSFADVLKNDSSVDLRQRGPNDIQGDLSIRGGSFSQTLVLLNGLRLNDSQSGHHNLDLPLPLDAMSEVQVLRGSGSTQYGSDAVSGVVNILARPAGPELRLRGGVGNFGVNQQSAVLGGRTGAWSGQLVASREFSSGFRPNRDYRNLGLTAIAHGETRLGASDVLLASSDRPFGADQFYGGYNSWERTRGWFASLRQELGAQTEASFAYRRHTDLFVLYRDRPQVFTNRHTLNSWQGALRRREEWHGNLRLFYGAETFADAIESNNLGAHSRVRGAGYAALEGLWRKRVSFSAGLRDEVHGAFRHALSPAAAAGVWMPGNVKLRGAVSRAFRLPAFTDLYYHDPANVGSADLRPESAWTFEAGADWRPSARIHAAMTVFERRDRDVIDYVRYSTAGIYRATNFQRLNFTGVEASLGVRASGSQQFAAQYTGLRGGRVPVAGAISKYVFNYPVHSGVVSWTGSIRNEIAARTRVGAVDRVGRDPYALWDVALARARGRLRPFIQFTNLADTVYEEIPGVAMPKRGIVGGLEWRVFGDR